MDTLTHLLLGYLLGAAVFNDPALVVLVTVMGVLPDIDTISWLAPHRFKRFRHRGPTHSLVFGLPASALAALITTSVAGTDLRVAFAAAVLGFASHVCLDIVNWGCSLLWPLRSGPVAYTVQWGLKGPAISSAIAGLALIATHQVAPAAAAGLEVALIAGWVLYLTGKLVMRLFLHRVYGARVLISPTAHPLLWHIVEAPPASGPKPPPAATFLAHRIFGTGNARPHGRDQEPPGGPVASGSGER